MSCNTNWDINKYKENQESNDHWELRRRFMERWQSEYPEERLVCLSRVFANVEFLGSTYPKEVMEEVAKLSKEITGDIKHQTKRTLVEASSAAKHKIQKGGVEGSSETPPKKTKIDFVKPGTSSQSLDTAHNVKTAHTVETAQTTETEQTANTAQTSQTAEEILPNYEEEFLQQKFVNLTNFRESMFQTKFGKLVILVRAWGGKMWNMQASCQACSLKLDVTFKDSVCSVLIDGKVIATGVGTTKKLAKKNAEEAAWRILTSEAVMVYVKEPYVAANDSRINVSDVSAGRQQEDIFGKPVETSVASKMMQMMGWKGGGLGAGAQGIAEPIRPHLQLVNRAGLGSSTTDIRQVKRAAGGLMQRYVDSECIDVDLVFDSSFSKEERAALHNVARHCRLISRSYGQGDDRFLVVRKKLDPFQIAKAIIQKGGDTAKYKVYIPANLGAFYRPIEGF